MDRQCCPSTPRSDGDAEGSFGFPGSARVLGFATYGPDAGRPIFFFHGLPGSRYDARYLLPLADEYNIRLIGIDRPGYGLSSPVVSRAVSDWPGDVLALADHLGIDTFRVIGVSCGGPYALACAAAISPDRLLATGVWSGLGPVGTVGINRVGFGWYGWLSWGVTLITPVLAR